MGALGSAFTTTLMRSRLARTGTMVDATEHQSRQVDPGTTGRGEVMNPPVQGRGQDEGEDLRLRSPRKCRRSRRTCDRSLTSSDTFERSVARPRRSCDTFEEICRSRLGAATDLSPRATLLKDLSLVRREVQQISRLERPIEKICRSSFEICDSSEKICDRSFNSSDGSRRSVAQRGLERHPREDLRHVSAHEGVSL